MRLNLTDGEISMLLGATLMHWGVPFHFTKKRIPTDSEQTVLDALSERLINVRNVAGDLKPQTTTTVDFSADERRLLVEVLTACIDECGDDTIEIGLHLKADTRDEVNNLLQRFISKQ